MDTSVSKTTPVGITSPSLGSIGKLWNDWTAPAPNLSLADHQKARLLAAMTLVFIPLAFFAIFSTPISNLLSTGVFTAPAPILFVALVLVVVAYVLSRTQNYRWGAFLIIAVPYMAAAGSALTSTAATVAPTAYFFMALSATFASLLLGARETVISGAIAAVLIILVSPQRSATGTVEWAPLSFALIVTATTALVSSIRDRNLRELEVSQQDLRQQVIETRAARERAEQSDKVKSAFLASMSHELRTPLNAIINFTRYVAKGSLGSVNEEQTETLGEVVDSAKHLLNLINDVLDMSKIEAGSLNLFVEDNVNVKSIVDSVVSTGKSLMADKTLEISVDVADDLPTIRGDRQRIMQILLNIMSNAVKFTEEGSIKVRAYHAGQEVMFSIQDTGPGIEAKDQELVFQAFKQTVSGLRQGGGTGLGMPISKSLAEAHGGRLWLESQPSKGTTFFVALPVKSEALTPSLIA